MRHRIAGNKLNRNSAHRKATVRDIAKATLISQRITTTKAKAKEARKLVDKLITLGKKGTLADKRRAFAILCDHRLVSDLFSKTSPRFANRAGGYTRIIPLGDRRRGDNAELALLELTEKEIVVVEQPQEEKDKKAKGKKAKAQEAQVEEAPAVEEAVIEESEETKKEKKEKKKKRRRLSEEGKEGRDC